MSFEQVMEQLILEVELNRKRLDKIEKHLKKIGELKFSFHLENFYPFREHGRNLKK